MSEIPMQSVETDPKRRERAEHFGRLIAHLMEHGAWERAQAQFRRAFEELDGLDSRRTNARAMPLAEIVADDERGELLRGVNALERHLSVTTLGDYALFPQERIMLVPSFGVKLRDALNMAIIRWFLGPREQ
jgi:hypothetical protein